MRFLCTAIALSTVLALYSYQVLPEELFKAAEIDKVGGCTQQRRRPDMATARQMRVREMIAQRAITEADFFHNLSPHDELLNTLYVIKQRRNDISDAMALDVPASKADAAVSDQSQSMAFKRNGSVTSKSAAQAHVHSCGFGFGKNAVCSHGNSDGSFSGGYDAGSSRDLSFADNGEFPTDGFSDDLTEDFDSGDFNEDVFFFDELAGILDPLY